MEATVRSLGQVMSTSVGPKLHLAESGILRWLTSTKHAFLTDPSPTPAFPVTLPRTVSAVLGSTKQMEAVKSKENLALA
ncbi:hypothetical protein ROHU_001140 [Labeo rohita]|uniref:Uncharacterized protein n=1 Tax=Labeo rohita TaxID=84645 RepID=A0A498P2F2_LABRO|nr:hypothetical protein ROHU_001140 [Labeo rohita]